MSDQVDDIMSDFWRENFGRSQTFDTGHRDALFEMLKALRDQAKRQFRRSECTGGQPFAGKGDLANNQWDAQVYYTLNALIDSRYGPKRAAKE